MQLRAVVSHAGWALDNTADFSHSCSNRSIQEGVEFTKLCLGECTHLVVNVNLKGTTFVHLSPGKVAQQHLDTKVTDSAVYLTNSSGNYHPMCLTKLS